MFATIVATPKLRRERQVSLMTTATRPPLLERRLTRCSLVVIIGAVLAALGAARVSLAGASHARQAQTLHYAVTIVNDSQVDLGARGPSVGDERTFYDVLFDNKGKRA